MGTEKYKFNKVLIFLHTLHLYDLNTMNFKRDFLIYKVILYSMSQIKNPLRIFKTYYHNLGVSIYSISFSRMKSYKLNGPIKRKVLKCVINNKKTQFLKEMFKILIVMYENNFQSWAIFRRGPFSVNPSQLWYFPQLSLNFKISCISTHLKKKLAF